MNGTDIHCIESLWPGWKVGTPLGRGSCGEVFTAVRHDELAKTTQYAAVKHIGIPGSTVSEELKGFSTESLKSYFKSQLDSLVGEINAMIELRGKPNIVSYEEHAIIPRDDGMGYDLYLRMELLTSLPNHMEQLKQQGKRMEVPEIVRLGIDIARAL